MSIGRDMTVIKFWPTNNLNLENLSILCTVFCPSHLEMCITQDFEMCNMIMINTNQKCILILLKNACINSIYGIISPVIIKIYEVNPETSIQPGVVSGIFLLNYAIFIQLAYTLLCVNFSKLNQQGYLIGSVQYQTQSFLCFYQQPLVLCLYGWAVFYSDWILHCFERKKLF